LAPRFSRKHTTERLPAYEAFKRAVYVTTDNALVRIEGPMGHLTIASAETVNEISTSLYLSFAILGINACSCLVNQDSHNIVVAARGRKVKRVHAGS
jgi:hypothetical protein